SIGPLVSLIAGILILVVPRLLNYIVAIYLIVIGLLGLFGAGHYHFKYRPVLGAPAASSRGRSSVRNFAEDRTPADDAALRRRIVGSGAMHNAAIVPSDELACLPAVLVGEVRMDGERIELLDQLPSLVVGHADDVLGVI